MKGLSWEASWRGPGAAASAPAGRRSIVDWMFKVVSFRFAVAPHPICASKVQAFSRPVSILPGDSGRGADGGNAPDSNSLAVGAILFF